MNYLFEKDIEAPTRDMVCLAQNGVERNLSERNQPAGGDMPCQHSQEAL